MQRWLPLIVILVGILVIFAGLVYDVLFAGIPYQDPTPALAAQYAFHAQIASMIRWSGFWISIAGGVALIVRWFRR